MFIAFWMKSTSGICHSNFHGQTNSNGWQEKNIHPANIASNYLVFALIFKSYKNYIKTTPSCTMEIQGTQKLTELITWVWICLSSGRFPAKGILHISPPMMSHMLRCQVAIIGPTLWDVILQNKKVALKEEMCLDLHAFREMQCCNKWFPKICLENKEAKDKNHWIRELRQDKLVCTCIRLYNYVINII